MDLPKHITGFLFSEGKISFPEFGTLILVKEEAKRNPVKNKIYGPKFHCIFQYKEYDEQNTSKFINYYSRKNQIETREAENEFRKLSVSLLSQIAEKNEGVIIGLGTFTKKDYGIDFNFLTGIGEVLAMSYQDFPLLVFKRKEMPELPVLVAEEEKKPEEIIDSELPSQAVFEPPAKTVSRKKWGNTGRIISMVTVLAFLCFLICISNIFKTQKTDADMAVISTEEIASDPASTIHYEDKIFDFDDTEQESIAIFDEETILELSPTLSEISRQADLNTLMANSVALRNAYGNATSIIICGSFKNSSNALFILNKIRKNKYNAFAEEYNGYIRIGIISNMSQKSPESKLIEIQRAIDERSWILLPPQD